MNKKTLKQGFTLIEIMITSSIFIVIATISTVVLFDTINAEKRSDVQNGLYEDARIFMDQLTTIIHNNAIDYEEYFSLNVIQKDLAPSDTPANDKRAYGMYFGAYGSRFFHPGESQNLAISPTENPGNLGIECSACTTEAETNGSCNPPIWMNDALDPDICYTIFTPSQDYTVGMHPFNPDDTSYKGSAFEETDIPGVTTITGPQTVDELYLINAQADKKTIFAKQKIDDDNDAVGMLEMNGLDVDRNGVSDLFTCAEEYSCAGPTTSGAISGAYETFFNFSNFYPSGIQSDPKIISNEILGDIGMTFAYKKDHDVPCSENFAASSFIPITPFRINIVDLKFIINPPEDPYKGFAEPEVQYQPTVTILVKISPAKQEKERYPGGWKDSMDIVLQRTVNTGVIGSIQSYPPTNDVDWLKELMEEKIS